MRARKFVTYMPITMQGSSHYNVNHRDIVQNYIYVQFAQQFTLLIGNLVAKFEIEINNLDLKRFLADQMFASGSFDLSANKMRNRTTSVRF